MTLEDILDKNIILKNAHAGKRCFVVGNGPSLNTQDITFLRNEVTIVATSFFRHKDAKTVNPNYWVFADPYFWEKPTEYLFPTIQHAYDKNINAKLFVPTGGFPFFSNFNTGPFIDIHFYHYDHSISWEPLIDFSKGIPPYGQNVMIVCLMLAFFLGCNPIYFIGCDHDFYAITRENYESSHITHFFPEAKTSGHIERLPWAIWDQCMMITKQQYKYLHLYASRWGFNVFNATRGGYLDEYPRVEYESLFPHRNQIEPSLSKTTVEPSHLGQAATKLINAEDIQSALALIDEALRRNINRLNRTEGLEYLKAICLAKLGLYNQALLFARQDRDCNPTNREKSVILIQQLEKSIKGSSIQ